MVVVVGSVGAVTFPTHAQNGRTVRGPSLQSAASGVGHVTEQVCGGVSWFVAEQDEAAIADTGIRIATAESQKTRMLSLLAQSSETVLMCRGGNEEALPMQANGHKKAGPESPAKSGYVGWNRSPRKGTGERRASVPSRSIRSGLEGSTRRFPGLRSPCVTPEPGSATKVKDFRHRSGQEHLFARPVLGLGEALAGPDFRKVYGSAGH